MKNLKSIILFCTVAFFLNSKAYVYNSTINYTYPMIFSDANRDLEVFDLKSDENDSLYLLGIFNSTT